MKRPSEARSRTAGLLVYAPLDGRGCVSAPLDGRGYVSAPLGGRGYVSAALGAVVCLSVALGAACGGGSPPSERLVNAEAAIRGAIEINANASPPRAALHLQLAQEQVDKAKRYIADGLNQRAELSLRQAQADAELAIALARNEEMKKRAEAARAKVDKLRSGKSL